MEKTVKSIPQLLRIFRNESDNFFLRRSSDYSSSDAADCDYKNIDVYYRILPEELPVESETDSVKISIYEENTSNPITFSGGDSYLPGESAGGKFKTGNKQHVQWPDVRDGSDFRDLGFYRPQLEVDLKCLDDPIKTPIEDADNDMPGWQCPQKGLGIHDLVYKHRPEVYMGDGEVVAEDGPIYPFDDTIRTEYRLRDNNDNPAWSGASNYDEYGDFPDPSASGDFTAFSYTYPVLDDSNSHSGTSKHRIQMQGSTDGVGEQPLLQTGDYTPYLCHYGIPPNYADNGDNHVFVQFWHYETSSYGPYDGDPANDPGHVDKTLDGDDMVHDADWEMAQLCVQLRDIERVKAKAGWLQPWGATASQHYYGQTLAWRHRNDGENSSREEQRRVIHADNNGYRFNLYIADNSHATLFREGAVNTETWPASPDPGTQLQYTEPSDSQDATTSPLGERPAYSLLPLIPKRGTGIYDWSGRWGSYHMAPTRNPPPGPEGREADGIDLTENPAQFFNTCRKHVDSSGNFDEDGEDDSLTILLEADGSNLFD